MNNGRYVTYIGKRKDKKLLKVLCIVIGVIFVLISLLGLLLGADSPEKEQIYDAVSENIMLKEEIKKLNERIEALEEELSEREEKVEDEYDLPSSSPSPAPDLGVAPRNIAQ